VLIINPGFKSKFVDLGRRGLQHNGYCQSGPADANSYKLANVLLKKTPDAVAIEVMFGGLELKLEHPMSICLTGADCDLYIDDKKHKVNELVLVEAGKTLRIGTPRIGLYSYLAFSQDILSPVHFGSVCAVERERLGGSKNDGTGLVAQQTVHMQQYTHERAQTCSGREGGVSFSESTKPLTLEGIVTPMSKTVEVRYVPAYQHTVFTHAQRALFIGQKHEVTHHISSMGVKLQGLPIDIGKVTMYSEGISKGAIQVTPNGQAIVMLHERQTIGGYPKIGSVISADIPTLSQCQAGTKIQFVECDVHSAREALLLHNEKFSRLFGVGRFSGGD
jgi:biotin-dependent carboxylase-like uncharacterized protein